MAMTMRGKLKSLTIIYYRHGVFCEETAGDRCRKLSYAIYFHRETSVSLYGFCFAHRIANTWLVDIAWPQKKEGFGRETYLIWIQVRSGGRNKTAIASDR